MRKVAVNGGYCRGSNRLDHLVQRGGGPAPEAFTMLELGARGGRRCVTRGPKLRGGNGGVSLSLCSAAWNIRGGSCRLSRPVRRGCRPESLSEVPEKVARLAFPRPLEGSSRRRCPVVVEESLAEKSV